MPLVEDKGFFKVPSEYQIRYRVIDETELKFFSEYAIRPSPTSAARGEIEFLLRSVDVSHEMRTLIERAFQLLLNIDQRLERFEEDFLNFVVEKKEELKPYEWVSGQLGASGVEFKEEHQELVALNDYLLLDILLPSLPEQRVVAAGKVAEVDPNTKHMEIEFTAIHPDDQEFIHRYSLQRQRELARERAAAKKRSEKQESTKED